MPYGVSVEVRDHIKREIRRYCHGILESPLRSEYVSVNEISRSLVDKIDSDDITCEDINRIAGQMMGRSDWAEKQSNLNWKLVDDPLNR
jgi:hypothetical protein